MSLLVQKWFWKLEKTVSRTLVEWEREKGLNLSSQTHRPSAYRNRTESSFICHLTSWKKTLAPPPETLERSKGMETTCYLQGNLSFSFELFCLCDSHRGQVHCGSVMLHRGWIWLLLLQKEQRKTNFSRFAGFGPVFRNNVFHDFNRWW